MDAVTIGGIILIAVVLIVLAYLSIRVVNEFERLVVFRLGKTSPERVKGPGLVILIPIVMIILSLIVAYPLIRWLTIIAAIALFLLNVVGLPTYPGLYDKFLIVVGLVFNVLTVWYAWKWTE